MTQDQQLDQPAAVRLGEELDITRLAIYLGEHLPVATGPLVIEQFPRGFSNLTYLLRLGTRELVLRRPPFGATVKGGHDMGREFRMLSGLIEVYPKVPRPLVFCADEAVIGAPFYVMERVQGVILRTQVPPGLDLTPELMGRVCLALIDTLVELHAIDYRAAGLAGMGRPEGYVARQIHGWVRRYSNARTDDVRDMEQVSAWLEAHMPPDGAATLIHNDFKYDNVVLDPAELSRVVAVLDWEMATVGDPLLDLGTTLGYWAEPGDPPALRDFGVSSLPGNLDRQAFAERYGERSGRDVSGILFPYVFGLFKIGTIVQQIYSRYRQGLTQDARFAGLINLVRTCGQMAVLAIEKERISRLFE